MSRTLATLLVLAAAPLPAWAQDGAYSITRVPFWKPGGGTLTGCEVHDVADDGRLVGACNRPGTPGSVAVMWTGLVPTILAENTANGSYIEARGVDPSGVIFGTQSGAAQIPDLIQWTSPTVPPTALASFSTPVEVREVCAGPVVVGWSSTSPITGFVWAHGGLHTLAPTTFGSAVFAVGCNDVGTIVGFENHASLVRAVRWQVSPGPVPPGIPVSGASPLGAPPGVQSWAWDINDDLLAVGEALHPQGNGFAVAWDLADPAPGFDTFGWGANAAAGLVNNEGTITGMASGDAQVDDPSHQAVGLIEDHLAEGHSWTSLLVPLAMNDNGALFGLGTVSIGGVSSSATYLVRKITFQLTLQNALPTVSTASFTMKVGRGTPGTSVRLYRGTQGGSTVVGSCGTKPLALGGAVLVGTASVNNLGHATFTVPTGASWSRQVMALQAIHLGSCARSNTQLVPID